jgi:hypothetical protein
MKKTHLITGIASALADQQAELQALRAAYSI